MKGFTLKHPIPRQEERHGWTGMLRGWSVHLVETLLAACRSTPDSLLAVAGERTFPPPNAYITALTPSVAVFEK